jgi:hypothetical protein
MAKVLPSCLKHPTLHQVADFTAGQTVGLELHVLHAIDIANPCPSVLIILGSLMGEVGKVIAIESRSTSVSLPIPIPRAWFYSIPLMVACASMAVTCAYLILAELSGLSGNRAFNTQHGVMDPPVQPQLPG